MAFIVHRGGDRFVLQSTDMGALVGLMLLPLPDESINMFAYNFGSTYDRKQLENADDFPELAQVKFFAIESLGFHDFDSYVHNPTWKNLHPFLCAEAKAIAYNSAREKPAPNPLIPIWQFTPPNLAGSWKVPGFGLWVNEQGCWLGNRDGLVLATDRQGQITHQHKLPQSVRCLVGNDRYFYASCDDGQIYALTGKLPQVVYNARTHSIPHHHLFAIDALVLYGDRLLLLDAYGCLTCLDPDLKVQWQQQTSTRRGWFLGADDQAIYHGHSGGVSCYEWKTGKTLWENATEAPVLCGQLSRAEVIVGTSNGAIYALEKVGDMKTRHTNMRTIATCDQAVYACTLAQDGQSLFAADNCANLYHFTSTGDRLGIYPSGCGAILSMQVRDRYLYGVTTNGTLACFDITAIAAIAPIAPVQSAPIGAASPSDRGVLVECIKQGSKLKVRAISSGYNSNWSVQFPRDLREEGACYRVEALVEAKQGGFYRVVGNIQKCL